MQEFVMLAGLPGSGESTLAKQFQSQRSYFVVSSDMIRLALNGGIYPRDQSHGAYSILEPTVWHLAERAVITLLERQQSVVLDATNLTRHIRTHWRDLVKTVSPGIHIKLLWCDGDWDSADRWQSERGHSPAEYHAIRSTLVSSVELPVAAEGFEFWRCVSTLEVKRSDSGRRYLALEISRDWINPYLAELQAILGDQAYRQYVEAQQQRDDGSYYLGVLTPPEFEACSQDVMKRSNNRTIPVRLLGLARAGCGDQETWFVGAESPLLAGLRSRVGLGVKHFHVTLGFRSIDIHNLAKDASSLESNCNS